MSAQASLPRRLVAEALGTAFLLMIVVGSGIMAERLPQGNGALALLANSLATGFGLAVLIALFGPLSGAHFNPAVTLALALKRHLPWQEATLYVVVQAGAAFVGVAAAHAMFAEPALFTASSHVRAGPAQAFSEFIASFGLLMLILGGMRRQAAALPYLVGAYIAAAYWFTASTSFANPAVTLARAATDTFAGIRPQDVPAFVLAQVLAVPAALMLSAYLFEATQPAKH